MNRSVCALRLSMGKKGHGHGPESEGARKWQQARSSWGLRSVIRDGSTCRKFFFANFSHAFYCHGAQTHIYLIFIFIFISTNLWCSFSKYSIIFSFDSNL